MATLTQLAQQAAAQIGFTPRRWWRETTDPQVLRVEVERRMVGAPPGDRSADGDHSTPAPGTLHKSGTCGAYCTPPFDSTHHRPDRNAAHGTFTKILRTLRVWNNLS